MFHFIIFPKQTFSVLHTLSGFSLFNIGASDICKFHRQLFRCSTSYVTIRLTTLLKVSSNFTMNLRLLHIKQARSDHFPSIPVYAAPLSLTKPTLSISRISQHWDLSQNQPFLHIPHELHICANLTHAS